MTLTILLIIVAGASVFLCVGSWWSMRRTRDTELRDSALYALLSRELRRVNAHLRDDNRWGLRR